MTDEQFRSLCNVYGFAPSRSLRELLDTAISQSVLAERNFCQRCGKRTNDIHTCTPPQEERFCDTHCTWADHAPGCVRAEPEPDSSGRMASHDPA